MGRAWKSREERDLERLGPLVAHVMARAELVQAVRAARSLDRRRSQLRLPWREARMPCRS